MATWSGWASLGGPIVGGRPVAGLNADGRLEVFGVGAGGIGLEAWHAWQTSPNNGWSAWGTLGSPPTGNLGDLTLAENADGRLELFVRVGLMSSGVTWHVWQNPPPVGGWSGWDTLGSPPGGLPNVRAEAARNADGRLEVFALGNDQAVWHLWQQTGGAGWSGWHSLGVPGGIAPFAFAVGEAGSSSLAVFVVVQGGGLWWSKQSASGWTAWADLGMPSGIPLTGVAAGRNADGRLEVFSAGMDLNVWHNWETAPGGAWNGWASLGAPAGAVTLDTPVIGVNADGRLELFTVNRTASGSEAWHIWQTAPNNGWSAWDSLGGNPGGLAVHQNADGRLEVFGTIGDGTPGGATGLMHRWQTAPNNGWSVVTSWVPTTVVGPISRLYRTTRGTTFAWGAAGMFQSDDAGQTWTTIPLPAGTSRVAVDPSDARTLFAAAGGSIQKSTNAGATWAAVLPIGTLQSLAIAVSPADPNLVFVAVAQYSGSFAVHRSQDGGTTWTQIEGPINGATCIFSVPILEPHPTTTTRVLRTSGCYAGRDVPNGDSLDQSLDTGVTWAKLFHPKPLFPSRLVGGRMPNASRWYLAAHFGAPPGGGKLFRTDDDGATWSAILDYATGPSPLGVSLDWADPDRVFASLTDDTIQQSNDAGATWTDRSGPSGVRDVLITADSAALLAATTIGVWRLDL